MTKTHDGLPVHGYKPPPQTHIDQVNNNKMVEEQTLQMLDELAQVEGVDKRWLAIGRTHIELAWMSINRAIFKPERVKL